MPEIVFDALVPESETTDLLARFERLAAALHVAVELRTDMTIDLEVERQLRDQLEDDAKNFQVARYVVRASTDLNQTAMTFARLLTPHADLPAEPVLLENEQEFEVDATYPWTVTIRP